LQILLELFREQYNTREDIVKKVES
jgi:hypothetical protein